MSESTRTLAWKHKVSAGELEIWTSGTPDYHATVEYYDRSISHWYVIQAAVKNHGHRGPVLQLTGPLDVTETSCGGVFVVSHPGPYTIAATSTDLDDGRSALVQIYKAGNEWFETEYKDVLKMSSKNTHLLIQSP